MYEDSPAFWHGELAKLRRRDRRTGPAVTLIRRLSAPDRIDFYNCEDRIGSAVNAADVAALRDMRRAAIAQPPGDLRTVVIAGIDAGLARLAHTAAETRHGRPRYRHYLEDRRTSGVVAVR